MRITDQTFEAFLRCPTKGHLIAHGDPVEDHPLIALQQANADKIFAQAALQVMVAGIPADEILTGSASSGDLKQSRYQVIARCDLITDEFATCIPALRLTADKTRTTKPTYVPVRFTSSRKISSVMRMLLVFDALALSKISRVMTQIGEICHGPEYKMTRLNLCALMGKARSILKNIGDLIEHPSPPIPILNKHCGECQFVGRCAGIAKEADDLSRLSKMSPLERQRYHNRGIFTVTQLSHTFRHRRGSRQRNDHALKALAIRKHQIHVLGPVALWGTGTPVYFDVEGDTDRDFYYCVGLRFESEGENRELSFWADELADEEAMWASCLASLSRIDHPRLIHYGSFEILFLRQMKKRYPAAVNSDLLEPLINSAVNLLAFIYARVYFPTYSNGLKEIAQDLGFRWSEPAASGLMALYWRREWDRSRDVSLKRKLITYNMEDCVAAEIVARTLMSLAAPAENIIDATTIKREYPQRFGETNFALPEFLQINAAARWDHQRERVHLRSGRSSRPRTDPKARDISPKPHCVRVQEERPGSCNQCGSNDIKRWGWMVRVIHDLKFTRTGVKTWVVRYSFPRYICWHCRKTFHNFSFEPGKYGPALRSYVIYQVIELQLSQRSVAGSLGEIFRLPIPAGSVNQLKTDAARRYAETYKLLLSKIVLGHVVHADETKATITGKPGYVWVFANSEDVVFRFSETRESSTPHEVLAGFEGVLVSDFYTGYDSVACRQQKCLIHLMRDINDDLCKQPFNEEMKEIARRFADLLRPMVASVDRFGLKARHLRKHHVNVDRFFKALLERNFRTDVAAGYQRRFEKNRDRLFTFLTHDGVSWNNNNAEHAIKAFARLRNVIGGTSTVRGMEEYLMLLSICQTCKNKGVSFLKFLRSQATDIDEFANRRPRGFPTI